MPAGKTTDEKLDEIIGLLEDERQNHLRIDLIAGRMAMLVGSPTLIGALGLVAVIMF